MSPVSGPDRPLRLRIRRDLQVHEQQYQGRTYWVLKDPLAQQYFRFEEEEYWIVRQLDGDATLRSLRERFEKAFAPQKISLRELHQLLTMLHRSSLLIVDAPGQGRELHERDRHRAKKRRLGAVTNILCIRFKGFDPDHLLESLSGRLGWLFSGPALAAALTLMLASLLLLAAQFETFRGKLPEFHEFFAVENWFWLGATLAVTKVLHEFGHGIACKRFGGECHEMGLMLLVLTPCLYCNVTDSWTLPSKWKRAAIGAAGMYFEMILAALATFFWWYSQPGLVHFLSLNVMFVASVSTLLFNANPLMRYDGYYILSDLLEIPNLRQKADTILRRRLARWTLGLPEPADPFLPQRHQLLFGVYAISAAVYRWFVVGGILWFVYHLFKPYGLQVVGQMVTMLAAYSLLVQPLIQLVKFFQVPGRYELVSRTRLTATVSCIGAAAAAVFLIPLPHYVRCKVRLEPRNAETAYVETGGQLAAIHVAPGQWIEPGQTLVAIENLDLRLEITQLFNQQELLKSRLAALRQRAFFEDAAVAEIGETAEALRSISNQLQNRQRQIERMEVVAPRAGYIIPLAERALTGGGTELPRWHGTPLDDRNLMAHLETGQPICRIGDPQKLKAVLAIDEGSVEFVQPGQPVEIVLDAFPGMRRVTKVGSIAQLDMQFSSVDDSSRPAEAQRDGPAGHGRESLVSTYYQGSADLDDERGQLFPGATGGARVRIGHQTIAERAWRLFWRTFSFDV